MATAQYQVNFTATSKWMGTQCRPSGAIVYTATEIEPYFANSAAIGMSRDPARLPQVVAYMKWYLKNWNHPDQWGLVGTIYDFSIANGVETSTGDCDSTDSYAATFLSLAWAAWQSGDPATQAYIKSIAYELALIGEALIQMQQSDGLTWAKPDYQIKYLMDNAEVYGGLMDLARLIETALGGLSKAEYYYAAAASSRSGILSMWQNGTWATNKNALGVLQSAALTNFYPDAAAQLFPVLMGVIEPYDAKAQASYEAFNTAWPGWTNLSFLAQAGFPWCLVACAAAAMGDQLNVAAYISTIQSKYVATGFPWPFYCAEAGWFLRANNFMMSKGL